MVTLRRKIERNTSRAMPNQNSADKRLIRAGCCRQPHVSISMLPSWPHEAQPPQATGGGDLSRSRVERQAQIPTKWASALDRRTLRGPAASKTALRRNSPHTQDRTKALSTVRESDRRSRRPPRSSSPPQQWRDRMIFQAGARQIWLGLSQLPCSHIVAI